MLLAVKNHPFVFVGKKELVKIPIFGFIYKRVCILVDRENSKSRFAVFERAQNRIQQGLSICIFPEGGITKDGSLQEFKGGVMKILERAQADGLTVPVVPMALTNLWGSFFSRVEQGTAMVKPFRRGLWSSVGLNVGQPLAAAAVNPADLQARVRSLLAE